MVALGRGARPAQVDPVLVLQDDPLARLEARRHRPAGVLVAVPRAQVPDLDRLGRGVGEVDEEGGPPAPLPLALGGQGLARGGEILESGRPLLELEELLRLAGERRVEGDVAVAEGDGLFRVAVVQGLGPDQRRGLVGHPIDASRPLGDAVDGHALLGGQVGQDLDQAAVHVPDLHRMGEPVGRQGVGIGPLDPADEEILHGRGGRDRVVDAGLADLADVAGRRVDASRLGRRVIVEEDLVESVLEQVLVGGDLGFLAAGDLDLRPDRDARRDGGRAAAVGDEVDDQAPAVRHPVHAPEHGVDDGRGQGLGGGRLDVDGPELDAAFDVAQQGDARPVGRPGQAAHAGGELEAVGQGDLAQDARLHVLERKTGREAQDLPAVERGRDAHAGDPQDGLGNIGDRRHRLAFDQGHRVAGRAHRDRRRRRRVDDVDDLPRRELVGLLGEKRRDEDEPRGKKDGETEDLFFQEAPSWRWMIMDAKGYSRPNPVFSILGGKLGTRPFSLEKGSCPAISNQVIMPPHSP